MTEPTIEECIAYLQQRVRPAHGDYPPPSIRDKYETAILRTLERHRASEADVAALRGQRDAIDLQLKSRGEMLLASEARVRELEKALIEARRLCVNNKPCAATLVIDAARRSDGV